MTTDISLNEVLKENGRTTVRQYQNLECRICGVQVFAPLLSDDDGLLFTSVELTCSRGHTDSYDAAELRLAPPKPPQKVQVRRAVAGIG